MIKSGNSDFDEFLNGGFGGLNSIYGGGGTGKTCACLMATINELKQGKKVIFIDTENSFNVDRFKQIAGGGYLELFDNLFLLKISSFKEQHDKIKEILEMPNNFSLVIVDTISEHFRRMSKNKKELAKNMLNIQLKNLKVISKKNCVILSNQVYTNIDENRIDMIAHRLIEKYSDKIIELKKEPNRVAMLKKPNKGMFRFRINDSGMVKE